MCNCRNTTIPSVFCSSCKELLCVACDKDYFKCSSCLYFSCNKCNIKLLCNHNYCSLDCAMENNKHMCTKKCFFFRDINSTDDTEYGMKNLLYYWINIELQDHYEDNKNTVEKWIQELESSEYDKDNIKSKIHKIHKLTQLL